MGNCIGTAVHRTHRNDELLKIHRRVSETTVAGSIADDFHFAFQERYQSGSFLGEGGDSCVYEAVDRETLQRVAMKVTLLNTPDHEEKSEVLRQRFRNEVTILCTLRHRNIVRLFDSHDFGDRLVMVLECARGGSLFDELCESRGIEERLARNVVVALAEAIRYLHQHNIVHRDLKPENILFRSKNGRIDDLLIVDFGFAAHCSTANGLSDVLGTLEYIAPEILRMKPYGKGVDMWALGVIMFNILSGQYPFYHPDRTELCRKIMKGVFTFKDHDVWRDVSSMAKDLIDKTLVIDPHQRITINDFLQHPWILSHDDSRVIQLSI